MHSRTFDQIANPSINRRRISRSLLVSMAMGGVLTAGFARAVSPIDTSISPKKILGPITLVEEAETDFSFPARVDTGATTSSLHAEECIVEGAASDMLGNVGKTIRFKVTNVQGESEWLERKIAEISVIKTSERQEQRYKVPLTLNCQNVKKRVLVSLNDRSHMAYPVLLGRNFLQGDFVVDVDLQAEPSQPTSQKPVRRTSTASSSDLARALPKTKKN